MVLQLKATIYPASMDKECVALCDVLNSIPGLQTVESCCGHNRNPFQVFFTSTTLVALEALLQTVHAVAPEWQVRAAWANPREGVYFCLQGPSLASGGDALARHLLDTIQSYED